MNKKRIKKILLKYSAYIPEDILAAIISDIDNDKWDDIVLPVIEK